MQLPLSREASVDVFGTYNNAWWPVALLCGWRGAWPLLLESLIVGDAINSCTGAIIPDSFSWEEAVAISFGANPALYASKPDVCRREKTPRDECRARRWKLTMTKPDISGIAPFFIVKNVSAALSFYRDRLGFDITFQGPDPDDIFFGIVQRGAAMIMFKDVGVDPLPNYTRDVQQGIARWDAYLHVPDPDALAAEFLSRNVEFSRPLEDDDDGLRGFELKDADGYVLFFGRPRS